MSGRTASVAVSLALAAAVCGLTAAAVPRVAFVMYDEGVYFYQGVLLARGQTPYADYFSPQPPGILAVGAASEWAGAGVAGVRAVNWACGLLLLWQTHRLVRWVGGGGAAGAAAAALLAVTVVFAYQSVHGATNMPSACVEVAACLLLLGSGRRRFAIAGLTLAAGTAIRLQSVIAAPGLLLLILLADGRRGFLGRAGWFLGGLAVGCAAIHLPPTLLVPGYFDNVVGFHAHRARADWADRFREAGEFLSEPAAFLGLPAAAWLLGSADPRTRGLAGHALFTVVPVTAAGNSLSVMYYLPVLPLLAACAAVAVARLMPGREWPAGVLPLIAAGCWGRAVLGAVLGQLAPEAEHAACVEAVRAAPGRVVLAVDGRVARLAGKELPDDYHATDPNALVQLDPARFHDWFDRVLPAADLVVVTPQLLGWMSPANAGHLLASGKPVFFDSAETRATFDQMYRPGGGSR